MAKRVIWHLEVPPHLDKRLEDYIQQDAFKTKSEFIRTAVRDRLEEEQKKLALERKEGGLGAETTATQLGGG